jgi:hypothetical protein
MPPSRERPFLDWPSCNISPVTGIGRPVDVVRPAGVTDDRKNARIARTKRSAPKRLRAHARSTLDGIFRALRKYMGKETQYPERPGEVQIIFKPEHTSGRI